MKTFKLLSIFLFALLLFSCNKDDDNNINEKLVGEWQRSDFNEDYNFTIIFNSDYTGYITEYVGELETDKAISGAFPFKWNTNEDILILNDFNKEIKTNYNFDKQGNLIINEYPNLYFIKVN